jgi:hypothetical protein
MTFPRFTNCPGSNSASRLDEFVLRMLNFKKEGTYVDIGSAHSQIHNNTHLLAMHYGWRGLCIELSKDFHPESYAERGTSCTFLNEDALKVDYAKVFQEMSMPASIDYLSLDVDIYDLDVAKILPYDQYCFKIIGIEHDAYGTGDTYREPQRELLQSKGYVLTCANVLIRLSDERKWPFEDWYLHPDFFPKETIEKMKCDMVYPEDIIAKLV